MKIRLPHLASRPLPTGVTAVASAAGTVAKVLSDDVFLEKRALCFDSASVAPSAETKLNRGVRFLEVVRQGLIDEKIAAGSPTVDTARTLLNYHPVLAHARSLSRDPELAPGVRAFIDSFPVPDDLRPLAAKVANVAEVQSDSHRAKGPRGEVVTDDRPFGFDVDKARAAFAALPEAQRSLSVGKYEIVFTSENTATRRVRGTQSGFVVHNWLARLEGVGAQIRNHLEALWLKTSVRTAKLPPFTRFDEIPPEFRTVPLSPGEGLAQRNVLLLGDGKISISGNTYRFDDVNYSELLQSLETFFNRLVAERNEAAPAQRAGFDIYEANKAFSAIPKAERTMVVGDSEIFFMNFSSASRTLVNAPPNTSARGFNWFGIPDSLSVDLKSEGLGVNVRNRGEALWVQAGALSSKLPPFTRFDEIPERFRTVPIIEEEGAPEVKVRLLGDGRISVRGNTYEFADVSYGEVLKPLETFLYRLIAERNGAVPEASPQFTAAPEVAAAAAAKLDEHIIALAESDIVTREAVVESAIAAAKSAGISPAEAVKQLLNKLLERDLEKVTSLRDVDLASNGVNAKPWVDNRDPLGRLQKEVSRGAGVSLFELVDGYMPAVSIDEARRRDPMLAHEFETLRARLMVAGEPVTVAKASTEAVALLNRKLGPKLAAAADENARQWLYDTGRAFAQDLEQWAATTKR